jgi:hypothetical protein
VTLVALDLIVTASPFARAVFMKDFDYQTNATQSFKHTVTNNRILQYGSPILVTSTSVSHGICTYSQ